MENTRVILLLGAIVAGVWLLPPSASAYERHTHQGLTSATIKAYEILQGATFGVEEERMIAGSSDEDDGTRPLNHFYDPLNYRGLTVGFSWPPSEEWAQDTEAQGNYCDFGVCRKRIGYEDKLFSSVTDFSWNRAIYEYVYGDRGRALETLGHILHLIQDATVPAHVRNDQHLNHQGFGDPDPYEKYSGQFDVGNISLTSFRDFPKYPDLGTYFYRTARFTNTNFVSKDSFFRKFELPNLEDVEIKDGFIYHPVYKNKIARIKIWKNRYGEEVGRELFLDDEQDSVAADYWRLLSAEAIRNGVGVINLFFEEVEKEKKTGVLKAKNTSAAEREIKKTSLSLFPLVKGLYGSSLNRSDVEDLFGESARTQSAAALDSTRMREWADRFEKRTPQKKEEEPVRPDEKSPGIVLGVDFIPEEKPLEKTPNLKIQVPIPSTHPSLPWPGFGGGSPTYEAEDTVPDAPTILFPSEGFVSATSTVTFSGNSTAGFVITATFNSSTATTSADGNGLWSITLSLPEGNTAVSFTVERGGEVSGSTERNVTVDLTAPSAPSLSVAECSYSLTSSICLVATTTVTATWGTAVGASYYGIFSGGVFVSTTTGTSATAVLTNMATTTIEAVAYDVAGNAATSSGTSVFVFLQPLIINEVAWGGTKHSSDDQWLELKNRTGYALDLSRLTLYSEDGETYIPLASTVAAASSGNDEDLYLVERASSATSMAEQFTASFTALSTSGEELALVYFHGTGTSTLDKTPPVATCSGWCAGAISSTTATSLTFGSFVNELSMERIDVTTAGSLSGNWRSNDTYQTAITDASGYWVFGTPRTENSDNKPLAGWFCGSDTTSITPGSTYAPSSGTCTYLSAFVRYPSVSVSRYGGLYRGTVGSSTEINRHSLGSAAGSIISLQNNDTITSPVSGESFFVAIWEVRPSSSDVLDFAGYFTTGNPSTPHSNYRVIEWTYGP